jgi:hypothetical protein
LYSLLGAGVYQLIPDWEYAFWAVSLTASTLLVIPVYLISHTLHGRSAARVAVAMVCVWPWLVDYAGRITPDALAVTLWFSSIWLIYTGVEKGGKALPLAPFALFALHLTRPEGTFLMLAAPLGALIVAYGRGRPQYIRAGIITGLILILLGSYALSMRLAIGAFTVSYRAPVPEEVTLYFSYGGIEFVRTFVRLLSTELPVMLGPFLMVFLGVGLFSPREKSSRARLSCVLALFCAIQWTLTLANFSPAPRYIMSIIVALSLWSARGMVVVAGQALKGRHGRFLQYAPVAIVLTTMVFGLALNIVPRFFDRMPALPHEYKLAGQWMKNEKLEPGIILSRKPQVGFYADMPTTGPALEDSVSDAIARAVEIGARYLVLDERYSAQMVPGLAVLLDPANAPPELKLLHGDLSPYTGAKIVIYEVVAPGIQYRAPEDFGDPTSHMGPYERRRTQAPE